MFSFWLIVFNLYSDFTKRNSNFGPVHPRQRSNLVRSIERNSIEEQDEKMVESSPEGMKQLVDENDLELGEQYVKSKHKGRKVNVKANGLDKNSETSTSNVNLAKIKSSSTSQLSVSGMCVLSSFFTKKIYMIFFVCLNFSINSL